ncbi:circularly permuted type 2 ATP-grasp protein [Pseudothauera rhizosphaerae]|uniref:Molybdopterin oxidoreductase n=1 Tax=Pseudothauera rhizosphaerae TaxID=2565932 RepID=A0A4S4AIK7_9RHOO|nr:circularly permuted type 2 ATP-grasp protein [Pseudothauera rhizosphaerae]THF58119.1 molybdopterin oxidoreductase [Pseudothauera rhizosphaerae]
MPAGLIETYPFAADRYDEMLAAAGEPRAHWQAFADRLARFSDGVLAGRADFVRGAIEADGVTYNVYTDPKGTKRPWELDMLPLIVGADEWETLSAAVAQRGRLLNAILADLYGPRTLLAEGLLPPALVFGQHGYKWPCQGVQPPGGIWLHSYAADLARAPDGKWWAIADRTQGPSGAGYALQNRLIVSRTFPDAFRELQVHTLAGFFRSIQDSLARLAPTDGEAPLNVLLTPGPYNETYFEHAFLARYLGFPLVEGQDLTVRDDTVYLKTLRGLRRVHAILRRLDDDFCDPLELRADSALGIPGLLGAIRAGRVLMANQLGSGVLESAALLGFLPPICERLLNEPLKMPSVATWWCGEEPALEYVLEHLDELVIKPAFPSMRMNAVFGHELKGESRRRMIERIVAQPHAYVGQEWVRLSQAPMWNHRLMPRSVGIRVFAAATPDGYTVMPGALGRVAPRAGMEVISMQRGGLSKDTWVRADAPVVRTTLLKRRLGVIDLVCGGSDIPSRVGENLFWMGRYAERCEASARLLRAALVRVSNSDPETELRLSGLLAAARRSGVLPEEEDADEMQTLEEELLAALTDVEQSGSVAANLRALAYSAGHVKERLSSDNWHALNHLEQLLSRPVGTVDQALSAIDQVMLSCISLAGFAMDDMTRDEGWRFLILGRRIERLAGLSALVSVPLEPEVRGRERMFEWLLEAANSIVTYRARYRRVPELLPLVHLLVFDATNPHSVGFQAEALQRYLQRTARELGHPYPSLMIDPLARRLADFDLTRFEADDCELAVGTLRTLLAEAEEAAASLSEEVHRRFFIHTVRPMHLRRVA